MLLRTGPTPPRFPLNLLHPLGPLFRYLPLPLRRHILYFRTHGRWGNFAHPQRFSEKIQWRILNDHREIITLACDKIRSKEFVETRWRNARIHDTFKVPATYWTGDSSDKMLSAMSSFPARFVMKPNASSGRVLLADFDLEPIPETMVRRLFDEWLLPDEETEGLGHGGYRRAQKLMIVEERLGQGKDAPADIRIFSNRGVIIAAACTGTTLAGNSWTATYDGNFQRRPSGFRGQLPLDAETSLSALGAEEIKRLKEAIFVISEAFDQVRVDLYRVEGVYYFGEFTAYSSGGLVKYSDEHDLRLGHAWALPDVKELLSNSMR